MGYGLGYGEGSGRVWVRGSGRRGRGESSPSSQQPESTGSLVPLLPSCCHPHAATPSYVSRARGSCASGWGCRCFTSLPPPTAWTSAIGLTPSPSAARSSSCTKAPRPLPAPRRAPLPAPRRPALPAPRRAPSHIPKPRGATLMPSCLARPPAASRWLVARPPNREASCRWNTRPGDHYTCMCAAAAGPTHRTHSSHAPRRRV